MRRYFLTVYQDDRDEWRWRLEAPNKKIVADSGEGYATRAKALRAARRVLAVCASGAVTVR